MQSPSIVKVYGVAVSSLSSDASSKLKVMKRKFIIDSLLKKVEVEVEKPI